MSLSLGCGDMNNLFSSHTKKQLLGKKGFIGRIIFPNHAVLLLIEKNTTRLAISLWQHAGVDYIIKVYWWLTFSFKTINTAEQLFFAHTKKQLLGKEGFIAGLFFLITLHCSELKEILPGLWYLSDCRPVLITSSNFIYD